MAALTLSGVVAVGLSFVPASKFVYASCILIRGVFYSLFIIHYSLFLIPRYNKSMNKLVIGSVLVMLVAIVGGWLLYRATMPVDIKTELEKTAENQDSQDGLFFQMKPTSLPPAQKQLDIASPAVTAATSPLDQKNNPAIPNTAINPPAAQTAASISIEDTGFVPPAITITPDTTVTFLNNGQAMHWPKSDDQQLPEFDAGKGLATGENYEYKFTKPGSWTYHDQLNPQLVGTIVVTE